MNLFTLKVFRFGSSDLPLLNKILVIKESYKPRHVRSIIQEEVNVGWLLRGSFNSTWIIVKLKISSALEVSIYIYGFYWIFHCQQNQKN